MADDYYALLGVDADASSAQLRRVWRRLALQWHPDRAGSHATSTFQKISAAYAVLSDPVARAAYDERRGKPARRTVNVAPRRRAPGVMLSRLSGSLNALLACGIARRAGPELIELYLRSEEIAQGGMVSISMRVPVHCRNCAGEACGRCGGSGVTEELFSAWLAVPPGVAMGTLLAPSEMLRGMVRPVRFRVQRSRAQG